MEIIFGIAILILFVLFFMTGYSFGKASGIKETFEKYNEIEQ